MPTPPSLIADLRQPHTLEFAFETTREAAALALVDALIAMDCEVELQAPEADDDPPNHWVIARQTLVPPVCTAVQSLSARFESLSRQHGASYDGWGAEIVE